MLGNRVISYTKIIQNPPFNKQHSRQVVFIKEKEIELEIEEEGK